MVKFSFLRIVGMRRMFAAFASIFVTAAFGLAIFSAPNVALATEIAAVYKCPVACPGPNSNQPVECQGTTAVKYCVNIAGA